MVTKPETFRLLTLNGKRNVCLLSQPDTSNSTRGALFEAEKYLRKALDEVIAYRQFEQPRPAQIDRGEFPWWRKTSNPATQSARETVHWFRYGERMTGTLTRLYRALMNRGFTEGTKRWIR